MSTAASPVTSQQFDPDDFMKSRSTATEDFDPDKFMSGRTEGTHEGTLPEGSYQNRPKGPILNANESPTHTAVRGVERTLGISKEPTSLGDALGQSASSLGSLGLSIAKDPLNAGKAVEGIASGLENAGRDVYQGLRHHDPRSVAHGTGVVAGILGPQAEGAREVEPIAKSALEQLPSKGDVGLALRTERGAIRPSIATVGRVGGTILGAGLGHSTGIPGGAAAGGLAGALGGYRLADAMIPERPLDIPTKVNPGAPLPSADEFYANKAADLTKRGREQSILDRADAKAKAAERPSIITPSQEMETGPNIESEGRPATWTNEEVLRLAGKGNRAAITQAGMRGLPLPENARYVMGDVDYRNQITSPREVTKFSPEGQPIRQSIAEPVGGSVPYMDPYSIEGPFPQPEAPAPTQSIAVPPNGPEISVNRGLTDIPYDQRIAPEELADLSRELGRPITEAEYPEIRRRMDAERNIQSGLAGNRRDVVGEIREEHRTGLEQPRSITEPVPEKEAAAQAAQREALGMKKRKK